MTAHLQDYPVIYKTKVAWGEMDALRHVNNTVYFRYFESGRLHYFKRTPMMLELRETGIGPILHSIDCRFRFPLTYPDRILVGVRVMEVGVDRLQLHQRVVSLTHDRVAAEGQAIVVMFDYERNQKATVSPALREAIRKLERF